MPSALPRRISIAAAWAVAIVAVGFALRVLWHSRNHPVNADLAMLHYSAWLMNEKGFLLYRDIFEVNFPLPFFFHQLLGWVAGYDAPALRVADIALLLVLATISWLILAPLSKVSAFAAPALFTAAYLVNGGEYILERDYLGVLPASAAFLLAENRRLKANVLVMVVAALCAVACSMKPSFIVLLPVLVFQLWRGGVLRGGAKTVLFRVLLLLLSFLLVLSLPFLVIAGQGVLPDFVHIYKTFLPIYSGSRYDLWHYDSPGQYWENLLQQYCKYAGMSLKFALPGLLWARFACRGCALARQRVEALALAVLAFTIYEVFAGKFWISHLLPSAYWTILALSLLLVPTPAGSRLPVQAFALLLVLACGYCVVKAGMISSELMQKAFATAQRQDARPQVIAAFLQKHVGANETVQVLDMAGDGQAALLEARAVSATRHLIDVPLYMEPASPDTQALRQELVRQLQQAPPACIVFIQQFFHPGGGNRLREFKPLYAWMMENYALALDGGDKFTVYCRPQLTQP